MEKVQLNSINRNQNALKYSKNVKSSTLPRYSTIKLMKYIKTKFSNQNNT